MLKNFDDFLNENFIYEEIDSSLKNLEWTAVGEKFTTGPMREKMLKLINNLHWKKIEPGKLIAGMPGLNLKGMIEQLNIPKPDMYAIGHGTFSTEEDPEASYYILAVQGNYKNGVARVYAVDGGDVVTPIASHLLHKEVSENEEDVVSLRDYVDNLPDWKQVDGVKVKSERTDSVGYVSIDQMDNRLPSLVFVASEPGGETGHTYDVDELIVLTDESTDESEIFEGLLGDIFGGFFKKIKQSLLKAIPGSVLKQAEKILAEYEKTKIEFEKSKLKEREKIYKAKLTAKKDPEMQHKAEEIEDRALQAIAAVDRAAESKMDRYNEQIEQLTKDKSDVVIDYVNLRVAQVKEKIATMELELAQKYSNEKAVEKLEKEVNKKVNDRKKLEAAVETAVDKKK